MNHTTKKWLLDAGLDVVKMCVSVCCHLGKGQPICSGFKGRVA